MRSHTALLIGILSATFLPLDGDAADRLDSDAASDRFSDPAASIDELIEVRLEAANVSPAPQSTDAEFCRRVWLDLAGVAPPVWELRQFLADTTEDKREKLIDRLLGSSRYATHMANRWSETLLPADALRERQNEAAELRRWLRQQFLAKTPYDHIVGGFLTAGGTGDRGPAVFYTSREVEPVKLAGATSRIFMGIQLECAQCHDHPTARWTQDDFWSFAAFFAQLEVNDANMRGGQTISDRPGREVTFPDSDRVMKTRYPGIDEIPEPDPMDFRRRQLTIWLASRNNPYFARAAVNRAWAHLFGRGLVDPVDSMDEDNPASHPELLQYLADYFVEQRFDLRALYRAIAATRAYGRTSAIETNGDAERERPAAELFAVMNVKTLSASQYFDSLFQNIMLGGGNNNATPMNAPGAPARNALRDQFVARMSAPETSPTEYPHGIVQALGMMNGPEMLTATHEQQGGLIASLEAPFLSDRDRIESLFLASLSRKPSEDEAAQFLDYLQDSSPDSSDETYSQASRLSDLTWILLNTAEGFVCP